MKTVAQKIGIKENRKSIFKNADEDALAAIQLPELDISKNLSGDFDYIHLFVKTQSDFIKQFPKLKEHLKQGGMLWISWPRGGKLQTDLNIKSAINWVTILD